MLVYFPHCLSSKTLNEVDLSNNLFNLPRTQPYDHLLQYLAAFETNKIFAEDFEFIVKPLSHLALYNLMDNCVPFKRQDIPRTLWMYFNLVGRCIVCMRWILPYYSKVNYTHSLPVAIHLVKDQRIISIPWQSMSCNSPNNCTRQV